VLTELRVRDLGVIEDLTLGFGPGMTALTGETGAGKTLLVEALQLVLGGRAVPGLVRTGAEEAMVEARFVVGEAEVVLARSVPADGRSRAWVDGRMAPVAALAEAGKELVDIHGQHNQQSLLSASAQRRALDEFARADLGPRHLARQRMEEIEQALAALGGDDHQRAREADVLRHQVGEITAAALDDPDEEEKLRAEEGRLAELGAHRDAASLALSELGGDESEGTALDRLGLAAAALAGMPAFAGWSERLRAALAELGDVASDLRTVIETWQDDPARLTEVQARRHQLGDLRRKYGGSLADVVAYGEVARRHLSELEGASEAAEELQRRRAGAQADLRRAEAELGRVRREAAPRLAAAAEERLRHLAMPGVRMEIAVDGWSLADPTANLEGVDSGIAGDGVRFLLGANPGEPLQPLARVASGGELARAMLALRLVATGGPDTMVFDEVDSGVGGVSALALGRALQEVSDMRQVLVVTHLAQVAAFADRQVTVDKSTRQGRTVTRAAELAGGDRVVELSRMLSGHPDSSTARAHAEELLASARRPVGSTTGGLAPSSVSGCASDTGRTG
jgi:DNA repair protein RecN (Recombination protein N)